MKFLERSAGYTFIPPASSMSLKFDMKAMASPKITDQERFPEMFAVNRKINRRKCTRIVPMRILVLGMCRTGTACTVLSLAGITVDTDVGFQPCGKP